MANSRSAEKSARVSARKAAINRRVTSPLRTQVKTARKSMESGDIAEAQKSTRTAVSLLDRAGSRGYIHRNKASRLASRLTKGLNRMISEPSQDAKPRSGSARRGASKKKK